MQIDPPRDHVADAQAFILWSKSHAFGDAFWADPGDDMDGLRFGLLDFHRHRGDVAEQWRGA